MAQLKAIKSQIGQRVRISPALAASEPDIALDLRTPDGSYATGIIVDINLKEYGAIKVDFGEYGIARFCNDDELEGVS